MNIALKLDQDQPTLINNHKPEIQAYIMYIAKLEAKNKLFDRNINIFRVSRASILSKSTPSMGIPSLVGFLPLKRTVLVTLSLCHIVNDFF